MRNIFISRRKFFKLSCIYSLFGLVIIFVGGGILAHYFFDTSLGSMSVVDKNIWIDTFFVVILAPIFETFLLQWMVIQTTEENSNGSIKRSQPSLFRQCFLELCTGIIRCIWYSHLFLAYSWQNVFITFTNAPIISAHSFILRSSMRWWTLK